MFFYHSATKGMIRANLDAFVTAKSDGMSLEEALGFMIGTRYSLFPEKKIVFFRLCALFQEYIEEKIDIIELDKALSDVLRNAFTDALDHVIDAFGELIMVLFNTHEIPKDFGEKEKEELKMLRGVISLMHIYESGAIFKSPQSFGFPTVKFLDDFIYNIDKEYYERLKRKQTKVQQKSTAYSKFKTREEYEAWKAQRIKELKEKQRNVRSKDEISVNDMNTITIEERKDIKETDLEQTKTEEQGSIKVSINEINEIKEEINGKRAIMANLSEEIVTLKRELSSFEAEYHARVGALYVRLDELELELREYNKRIKLLKSGKIYNLVDLEKVIEEQFQKDKEKINKEKEEAEQYTEEYEAVKEKPKLDEESKKKLKSLYRELAKKYHPDMARTSEEKERYNTIMAEINQAYNGKDLGKLEELAMRLKIPEETFAETVEEEFERLQRESEKLDDIISRLENELAAIKNSDTYKFKMRTDEFKSQDRDLLKELEDNLKAKIEQREEELEQVKREFKNLSKDLA